MSDDNGPAFPGQHVKGRPELSHVPDESRLPKCVIGWAPIKPDATYCDGEQWLMAVPVCNESARDGWDYELAVVTIRCDDDYFCVECEGDLWGWEIDDVDFGVRLCE